MKNAKKVILFLGAILLVAFGSFNTIGSKSNKNAVAETKEETTSKKESKKADAVAVAVENNGQVQNTVQGQPVEVTNVEGNVQGQPVVNQNVKQSHKKNKKNQKAVQANSEAKENGPAEVAPVVKEAPKAETKVETSKKAETKSESKGKEESSSSSNND